MTLPFEESYVTLERQADVLMSSGDTQLVAQGHALRSKAAGLRKKAFSHLSPWEIVQLARHPRRPRSSQVVRECFERSSLLGAAVGDGQTIADSGLFGALAQGEGYGVVVLGLQRPVSGPWTVSACQLRTAEGWIGLAERFGITPLILVDTAEHDDGGLNAEHFSALAALRARIESCSRPAFSVVLGEAAGELAGSLISGSRVLMLQYAYYAACRPERAALEVLESPKELKKAARALRLRAEDLLDLGVVNEIVPEPDGGAHRDPKQACRLLSDVLRQHLIV